MRPLDVGVIGCGTAGGAAALFLARAGHKVTIYERVSAPRPVGAGITIQPVGLHVLCRLGLHNHVLARGARIDRLLCETKEGKPVVDLTYRSLGEGLFGIGLHRGVLFEGLVNAAEQEPNITIQTGVEVVDLARAEGQGRERRSWLVDVNGDRHGPHELVVVADGARSQLRDDTSTSKRVDPYPWGALWFVGNDPSKRNPDGTREARASICHQIVDGNQRFLGMLPTGRLPSSPGGRARRDAVADVSQPSPRLVSLFWSIRWDRVDEWRKRGLSAWKDEIAAMSPVAVPIVEQIESEEQVLFARYHDVVMHRWHTRNVVYVGDAGHATSPQLGQGANLALWDAMTLGESLAAERHDLAAALAEYTRRRTGHLGVYQAATRLLTPFFQGDVEELGRLRDLAMPLMARVPYLKRMMTLAMLGVLDGFLGDTLTLELPVIVQRTPEPVKGGRTHAETSAGSPSP